ncbi:MAG: hypothetical protein J6V93_05210 [Clostridia bacterium]|nr:hypothetical protein [Clostridia bacterium]
MSAFTYHAMRGQYKHERVSGETPLTLPTNISCEMPNLLITGKSIQSGTPSDGSPVTLTSSGNEFLYGLGDSPIYMPTLRSAGEAADIYDVKAGKITRRIAEVIVDGVNVQVTSPATANSKICYSVRSNQTPGLGNLIREIITTHFITDYNQTEGHVYMAGNNGQKSILFFPWDQTLDTTNKMNAWFKAQCDAGTPVKMIYALGEPTTEDAPAYTPIQRAGGSIITDSGNAAGVTLDVTYLKHA